MSRARNAYLWLAETTARQMARFLPQREAIMMQTERESGAFESTDDSPPSLRIVDRGADLTVVSFSSAGWLHSGMPTFAFEGLLDRLDRPCNRIFLRDVHRMAYHLTPNRENHGLAHFESVVGEAMAQLGGTRHVAIGESSGAAAALYFGTRCRMDKVIAFAMPYPISAWASPSAVLGAMFNVPELIRDPTGYKDRAGITIFSVLARRTLRACVGEAGIFDPVATYLDCDGRPDLTLFYGERCAPDAAIADMLAVAPEARFVPLPTGRHILWATLARRGSVEETIRAALEIPGNET